MSISHKSKAMFIHIPKTGGQSICSLLGLQKGDRESYYYRDDMIELTHYTVDMMPNLDYYKFTFVRNPYDRIASEYNHRMRNLAAWHEPTNAHCSFEEYMEILDEGWECLETTSHYNKSHVVPMSEYVDETVEIYRFEDFENEARRLQKKLGLTGDIPKVNVGEPHHEHTDRTIEITRELYAEDFEMFGYPYSF